MKSFKTEGIIIKRRNYGEADRLLTVFTKYYGKIHVKAVGIRRIPSRRSAHVELLNHSTLGLYKGRSYAILTEAETIDNFSSIKNNLEKIGQAYHLCELIDGLCPENQENTKVFHLLKNTLSDLSTFFCHSREGGNPYNSIIRQFEIELLVTLGYWSPADMLDERFDSRLFIENILERKLKSHHIFAKLQ